MDDNAPAHRAWLVQNALIQNNVVRMEWPALSPDLNPIENLWNILGGRIDSRDNLVTTVQELTDALIQEWQALDQTVIRNTIRTMRRRCIECINNHGAPTSFWFVILMNWSHCSPILVNVGPSEKCLFMHVVLFRQKWSGWMSVTVHFVLFFDPHIKHFNMIPRSIGCSSIILGDT